MLYLASFNPPTGDPGLPPWVIPAIILSAAAVVVCIAVFIITNRKQK